MRPTSLVQLNPNSEPCAYISALVNAGKLDAECARTSRSVGTFHCSVTKPTQSKSLGGPKATS